MLSNKITAQPNYAVKRGQQDPIHLRYCIAAIICNWTLPVAAFGAINKSLSQVSHSHTP